MTTRRYSLVFGLGITGTSIVRYLNQKSNVLITDTRLSGDARLMAHATQLKHQYPSVRIVQPVDLAQCWPDVHTLYLSPGIPLTHDLVVDATRSGVEIRSDIDLFLDAVVRPVIAITGTNGKSTVVSLTALLLKSRGFVAVGNIGRPVLDVIGENHAGYVLELSSFQLERITEPRFRVAACMNITEDHMDHHESFKTYVASKHRIYENSELAIFNGADEITKPQSHPNELGINQNPDWSMSNSSVVLGGREFDAQDFVLQGKHNRLNILFAAASAFELGMSVSEMMPILKSYKGLPHRLSEVGTFAGITFINDSKSTNVGSTIAALDASCGRPRPLVLLLGGDSKAQDLTPLEPPLINHVDHVVVYGRDRDRFIDLLQNHASISSSENFEDAVNAAIERARPKGTVLLSPACASFDLFENYEERGRTFCCLTQQIIDKRGY